MRMLPLSLMDPDTYGYSALACTVATFAGGAFNLPVVAILGGVGLTASLLAALLLTKE